MTYLIVLGLYFGILFVFGFLSRRSLGVPSLALAAGAVIANLWTESLTPYVAQAGLVVVKPPLTSIVAVTLTLLPALVVMVKSPKVASHRHSILGSLVFATLGVMLTYAAFSNAVVLDEGSKQVVKQIFSYEKIMTTVAIVVAIVEVLAHRPHRPHPKK